MREKVRVVVMEIINDLVVLKIGQGLHCGGAVPIRAADDDPVVFVDIFLMNIFKFHLFPLTCFNVHLASRSFFPAAVIAV